MTNPTLSNEEAAGCGLVIAAFCLCFGLGIIAGAGYGFLLAAAISALPAIAEVKKLRRKSKESPHA